MAGISPTAATTTRSRSDRRPRLLRITVCSPPARTSTSASRERVSARSRAGHGSPWQTHPDGAPLAAGEALADGAPLALDAPDGALLALDAPGGALAGTSLAGLAGLPPVVIARTASSSWNL